MTSSSRRRAAAVAASLSLGALALGSLSIVAPAGAEPAVASSSDPVASFAPQLVLVDTPSTYLRDKLSTLGLDLTEHAGHDYVEVVLHTPADLAALTDAGFTYEVTIPDLVARDIANRERDEAYAARVLRSALPSGRTTYRTLADYNADLAALAEAEPKLVREFTLDRPSLDGKEIHAVEIGSDVTEPASGRPTFLLMGVHHAREWPSGELAMEFATDLATNYGKDPRITRLLDRARVIVVPIVNVDGFDLSRTDGDLSDLRALNSEDPLGGTTSVLATPGQTYKRKNCRVVDGADTPDGSCRATLASPGGFALGVDLNRNYGGFWGGPGAAATEPDAANVEAGIADPTYRGPEPFSEPETQNVRDLISSRQVTMMISLHTFSNLVLRPNGVAPTTIAPDGIPVGNAPDEKGLKKLGARFAAQNGYQNIHGWQLYDTTGTTEDWSYNATGGYGYTFEVGANEFHPPYAEVVDEYVGAGKYAGKGNREAFLIALEHAVDTDYSGLLTGRAPAGAVLRLHKTFQTPTWESSFEDSVDSTLTVPRNGRFSWIVNPSTRPVVRPRTYAALDESPFASQTFEGGPTEPVVGTVDHEYVAAKGSDLLRVALDWPTPDDYDLEVYRKVDGELVQVGSSGNSPGSKEQVEIVDAPAGTYVVRVINFASASPSYTVQVDQFDATTKRTKGTTESYTLSCEVDGDVRSTQKLFIDRGQRRAIDLRRACD